MKVPTKESFSDWKSLFQPLLEQNIALADEFYDDVVLHKKDVRQCAQAFVAVRTENIRTLYKLSIEHEVMRWLHDQPSYMAAHKRMFKRMNLLTLEDSGRSLIERCVEARDARIAGALVRRSAKASPLNTWSGLVAQAVDNYLHVDLDRKFQRRRIAGAKLVKSIVLLRQAFDAMEGEIPDVLFDRTMRGLVSWGNVTHRGFERNQKNKRERQFVKDIALANRSYGDHKSKPEVIADLMSMGCIEHPLDLRTIQRICSGMTRIRAAHTDSVTAKVDIE